MDEHISASGSCAPAPDNPAEPAIAPSPVASRPKRPLPKPLPKRAASLGSGSISSKRACSVAELGATAKPVGRKEGFELDIFLSQRCVRLNPLNQVGILFGTFFNQCWRSQLFNVWLQRCVRFHLFYKILILVYDLRSTGFRRPTSMESSSS